jgi:two-component system sensor histidine kinase CpxA
LGDPDLLLRSISNLIRNAIRYAGEAGPITIRAEHGPGFVKLILEDCGPGIPEAALAQVFDPFYRADPSRSRETGGVGLGMAIVKTCVESCSGTVSCRNRTPSGLEVTLTLKAALPPEGTV